MNEKELLNQISESYYTILGPKLVGIYVHGSIAFGCFNWDKSDIDFLVVINDILTLEEKKSLIKQIIDLEFVSPPKGFEMSVILEKYCKNFVYPTPYELHYSNNYLRQAKSDLDKYCLNMNGVDKDLASHFIVVQKVGFTLYGCDIHNVFSGEVPKNDFLDSIKIDIENSENDIKKSIEENDNQSFIYIVLNLCRVLAFISQNLVLSKEQGGKWGIKSLPMNLHSVINAALESYQSSNIKWADQKDIKQFVHYMITKIFDKKDD